MHEFSNNIEESAQKNGHEKTKKKNKNTPQIGVFANPEQEYVHTDVSENIRVVNEIGEENDSEDVHQNQVFDDDFPDDVSDFHREENLDPDMILNNSHETGTPDNSLVLDDPDNNDSDFDDQDLDAVETMHNELNLDDFLKSKMKNTDVRKLLSGERVETPVLQVHCFEKLSRGNFYRAKAHNGSVGINKFTFSSNLNDQIHELLGKFPVIELQNYKLYNDSFVVVKEFIVLDICEVLIGEPDYLTEDEYQFLRSSKSVTSLATTPSLITKKMSSKHVDKVDCSKVKTSDRVKRRNIGSI